MLRSLLPSWGWGAALLLALAACSRRDPGEAPARPPIGSPSPATSASAEPKRGGGDGGGHEGSLRGDERQRLVQQIQARGVENAQVLRAMRDVPRHLFVPESWAEDAYEDRPLPIGHGQTISQPTVVAAMTEAAAPKRSDKCLEIGTGSGYQAAVLAELCGRVFSIEYLAPLAEQAERSLRRAGYGPERVALRTGDGYVGWPEAAPFEVVLVTAAPERVPQPLLDQLAVGGRLVIPVGARDEVQELLLYRRKAPGASEQSFEKRTLMAVRFVPFLGDAGH
ncbi:MAG TPA: protein-L-isoaspartate(D-aspartate) O-methyltransferase [Polyangiaceae bacterium]